MWLFLLHASTGGYGSTAQIGLIADEFNVYYAAILGNSDLFVVAEELKLQMIYLHAQSNVA